MNLNENGVKNRGPGDHLADFFVLDQIEDYSECMRFVLFLLFPIISVLFAACDHPPVPKELPDHNTLANSNVDRTKVSSPLAAEAPYELQFIDTMIATRPPSTLRSSLQRGQNTRI